MDLTKLMRHPHMRHMPRFDFQYSGDEPAGESMPRGVQLSAQPDTIIVTRYGPAKDDAHNVPGSRYGEPPGVSWEGPEIGRNTAAGRVTYAPGLWQGEPPGVAWEGPEIERNAPASQAKHEPAGRIVYAAGKWSGTPPGVEW